jgi:hypothetical protein
MSRGRCGHGYLGHVDADAFPVKQRPHFVIVAQRYVDCAFVHISRGEQAINEKERLYHAATAGKYLLLAESELKTARVHAPVRRKRAVFPTD